MGASLISPSGKVLVRRARCSLQPAPDPPAMPVLINGCCGLDLPPRPPARDGDAASQCGAAASLAR